MKQKIPILVLFVLFPVLSVPNTLTIKTVHAADLVEFKGGFKVRLTGITVPDTSTKVGKQAYKYVKHELEGRTVKVFTHTTNNLATGIVYGDDGLPFAQIFYETEKSSGDWSNCVNEELLKKGYAHINERFLPKELQHYHKLEYKARGQKRGMWKNQE